MQSPRILTGKGGKQHVRPHGILRLKSRITEALSPIPQRMCSRDTVVEAAKRCPNEPCSGTTGQVQKAFCARSTKSQATEHPPNRLLVLRPGSGRADPCSLRAAGQTIREEARTRQRRPPRRTARCTKRSDTAPAVGAVNSFPARSPNRGTATPGPRNRSVCLPSRCGRGRLVPLPRPDAVLDRSGQLHVAVASPRCRALRPIGRPVNARGPDS